MATTKERVLISSVWSTSAGAMGAVMSPGGLCFLRLPHGMVKEVRTEVRARFPQARPASGAEGEMATLMALCRDYFSGRPVDLSGIPLDLDACTPFQRNVYRVLRKVPRGRTVTYGELARRIGTPGAARAVAGAMARNPVPLVVPCHRVVSAGGLGGFSAAGGTGLKRRMLALEAGAR